MRELLEEIGENGVVVKVSIVLIDNKDPACRPAIFHHDNQLSIYLLSVSFAINLFTVRSPKRYLRSRDERFLIRRHEYRNESIIP